MCIRCLGYIVCFLLVVNGFAETIHVPHLVNGWRQLGDAEYPTENYRTEFHLMNVSDQVLRVHVELWDDDGEPLNRFYQSGPLFDPTYANETEIILQPLGSEQALLQTPFPFTKGRAVISVTDFQENPVPAEELGLVVTLSAWRKETADSPSRVITSTSIIPQQLDRDFSLNVEIGEKESTGVALFNPSEAETAQIDLKLIAPSGLVTNQRTTELGPLVKIAQFLNEEGLFTEETSFKGALRVTSSIPLAATAIRVEDTYWSTFRVFPLKADPSANAATTQ
jgi:hypothetical protein